MCKKDVVIAKASILICFIIKENVLNGPVQERFLQQLPSMWCGNESRRLGEYYIKRSSKN